jgi:hypothetical protein
MAARNVTWTHLFWGYKLSRAEELLKVTAVCTTVCNLVSEREDVTIDPKKVTCPACRERERTLWSE